MREIDPVWSEEMEEFTERRAELLGGFIERHEVAVIAAGGDPKSFDAGNAAQVIREFREAMTR